MAFVNRILHASQATTPDDVPLFVTRQDFSGGMNTRMHKSEIGDNQAVNLTNIDIGSLGKMTKRRGSVQIGDDVGNSDVLLLHNYEIQGATDQLLMVENQSLHKWTGSGNWSSVKTDFSVMTECGIVSCKESGLSPDDVVLVSNGTDNVFRIDSSGNEQELSASNTSPPKTTVMTWHGNRVWCLKDDLLYFSDAYPADYDAAFDQTTNNFRIPVGDERALVSTRDLGIVCFGLKQVWALNPSVTPAPATDKPVPLLPDWGAVSKRGVIPVGDDIFFFAQDGLRALKRTVQDKLQTGTSYPLSYALKDEFEDIDWSYIDRLSMAYFDNKIFISVPVSATAFKTWTFYPATATWIIIDGWSPLCWAKYKVSGEEFLYYGKYSNGVVYRAWSGNTDEGTNSTNGTATTMTFEGRQEDLERPLIKKFGGELEVRAIKVDDYNLSIYGKFDDTAYNLLGTISLADIKVTFPTTFPVDFGGGVVEQKFHLDSYGAWRHMQVKIEHAATNNTDDLTVLSYNIVSNPEEYESE